MAAIPGTLEKEILIAKINNSYWWHVPPSDRDAYKKRGKFFSRSTFAQAIFMAVQVMSQECVSFGTRFMDFQKWKY